MENNKITNAQVQEARNIVALSDEEFNLETAVALIKSEFFNKFNGPRGKRPMSGKWVPGKDEEIRNRFYEITPEMIDAMAKDYPAIANRMGEMMRSEKYNRDEIDRCYRNIDVLNAKLQVYEHMTGATTVRRNGDTCGECKPCDF